MRIHFNGKDATGGYIVCMNSRTEEVSEICNAGVVRKDGNAGGTIVCPRNERVKKAGRRQVEIALKN